MKIECVGYLLVMLGVAGVKFLYRMMMT